MTNEELNCRYGAHVSQRIGRELSASEFASVDIDDLPEWLDDRARTAHKVYLRLLGNPMLASTEKSANDTRDACRRWREAEDLAYLVSVAEDVGATAVRVASSK